MNYPFSSDNRGASASDAIRWVEVAIHTTREGIEPIGDLCLRAGADGTVVEDKCEVLEYEVAAWELFDETLLESYSDDVLIKCYFPDDDRLTNKLSYICAECENIRQYGDYGSLAVDTKRLAESDWENEWKKFFTPFKAGDKFVIKPTWEEYEAKEGETVLEIDPGMAFGTGTHETTKLCIRYIEKLAKPGMAVIDIGCGSGILGLAASLCGAESVLCIDNDPMCVGIACHNVRQNRLENVAVIENDLLDGLEAFQADLILVNILADVVIRLLPDIVPFCRNGGHVVASGIIKDRVEDVLYAASEAGFRTREIQTLGEWAAICFAPHDA